MNVQWFRHDRKTAGAVAAAGAVVLCSGVLASAASAHSTGAAAKGQPAQTAAAASGYWEGTDSWPISISGSAPYHEPAIGGDYGGYIGMAGNWAYREGCHGRIAWSPVNSAQADTNFSSYHLGIGTGVYWFMGGPGVDPHYNGSTYEATSWGAEQAAWTLSDVSKLRVTYPVIFEDVELPGIAPARDNGWNSVYTSPCSGIVRQNYVSVAVDRAEFNGFANYVTSHSAYKVGVYSSPAVWDSIFGTGSYSLIPNTYEWTYTGDTSSLAHVPAGWCLAGTSTCAGFFGGQNSGSRYALIWQWSGGGGTRNGYGDFDQIDASRTP